MNNVQLVGRLADTPQIRISKSLTKFTFVTIAVRHKDNTSFIDCTAFNGLAEWLCKYFYKGDYIAINGHLSTSDKDQNYKMNVIIDEAYFCQNKANAKTQNETIEEGLPEWTEQN